MVRRRSPALRPVVDDKRIGQSLGDLQEWTELAGDALRCVVFVNNREVPFENREWIAIKCEPLEGDTLLLGIKIVRAQKTSALRNGEGVHGGHRAFHAMRNVPNENLAAENSFRPCPAFAQAFESTCQRRPCGGLLG